MRKLFPLLAVFFLVSVALAAIDSEDKRRSISQAPGLLTALPTADGSINAANRAHLAGIYSGLDYSGGGSPGSEGTTATGNAILNFFRRRLWK